MSIDRVVFPTRRYGPVCRAAIHAYEFITSGSMAALATVLVAYVAAMYAIAFCGGAA
jgi:hypothetical protein